MPLRDIVNVVINREVPMVTRVGFGTPLFIVDAEPVVVTTAPPSTSLTTEPPIVDERVRVMSYSSLVGVAEDYEPTDAAYKMAQAAFAQDTAPKRVKIGLKYAEETYGEALMECVSFDNDFYGVAIESKEKGDILDVAMKIEALQKIFAASTSDADVESSLVNTDVVSELVKLGYARTFIMYHTQASTYHPDCAWLGDGLPRDPGSATWKFKTLNGIPVDSFSTNTRDTLINKGANIYEKIAGVSMTREGVMAESHTTFIDIIHGIDWLQQRMMERIFARLTTAPKVPYTNDGIAIIESLVRAQLDQGIAYGVIAPEPEYTVSVPDVLDCDPLDRADRILRDVKFNARLAGAIHTITITGTVSA